MGIKVEKTDYKLNAEDLTNIMMERAMKAGKTQ